MKIGERIKAERQALKMTRHELVERAGVKYSTLAGIENGDQGGSTQLHAIAEALNVTPRWLENGTGPKRPKESQAAGIDLGKVRASVELLQYTLTALGRPPELVHDLGLLELAYRIVDDDGRDLKPAVKLDLNQKLAARIRETESDERREAEGTGGKAGRANSGKRRRG